MIYHSSAVPHFFHIYLPMCLSLPMAASSSSLNFSSITRIELGRSPNWAVPNFLKLRRDPSKNIYLPSRLCVANGGGVPLNGVTGVVEGDGVIIVDHGSRRKESNLMLNEFVVMFRDKTKYLIVEPAHMELAEPSIKDAFDSCVRQGARRVIVSPFFLFPGRHWNQDIPALTAEAAKEHPGVSYVVTAPLSLHEKLVDVVNDRITYCLSHVAGEAEECLVCAGTGKCQLYHGDSPPIKLEVSSSKI